LSGYSFKFEKLLNYKEKIEDIKKVEFTESSNKLNMEVEKLSSYNRYKESLLNKKNSRNTASVGEYRLFCNYINDLTKKIENQKKVVEDAKEEFNKAKEELLVAMQERKSFEKLKEIQYEAYLNEMKKQEEKLIDNIVTYKTNTQQ